MRIPARPPQPWQRLARCLTQNVGVQKRKEIPRSGQQYTITTFKVYRIPDNTARPNSDPKKKPGSKEGHLYSSVEEEKFAQNVDFEKSQEKTVPSYKSNIAKSSNQVQG